MGTRRKQFFYSIVAAVDYTAINGAVVQSSTEGIESIGFLDAGDSMTYQAKLPVANMYRFLARLSTPDGMGSFAVIDADTSEIYATVTDLPATEDWEVWATKTINLLLPEGTVNLKIEVSEPGFNLLWMALKLIESELPSVAPTALALTELTPAPTTLSQTQIPTALARPLTTAPSDFVPDQVTVTLPPPPDLQSDMCLTSLSAMDYLMMNGCDINSGDGTMMLRPESSVLFSLTVPTSGTYLLQMTVVLPSTGALELVERRTEEQYAIIERSESDVATDEPKWSMVNNIVSLSSGTHLIHMRSLLGKWTLSALYLQSIDSSNTCGGDKAIKSSGPFVQEEAERIFGKQQEDGVAAEVATESQHQKEFFEEVLEVPEESSEAALFGEQAAEGTTQETPECAFLINANSYSSIKGISALNYPTHIGAIGFLDPGDWFAYNLIVPKEGTYELNMVVASVFGEGAFEVINMTTQDVYATVDSLPVTESWDTWGIATTLVELPRGPVSLMIRVLQNGWNLESLCLKAA